MPAARGETASDTVSDRSSQSTIDTSVPAVVKKIDKWCGKIAVGEVLSPGAKIIPMKMPLSQRLFETHVAARGLSCAEPHTIPSLLSRLAARGETLGLILNLSANTALYAEDLPASVQAVHLPMEPKVLPDESVVQSALDVLDSFLRTHPHQCAAVHCDYGCNRTGFVLVRYLVERASVPLATAQAAVTAARGYPINNAVLARALTDQYGSSTMTAAAEQPVQCTSAAPALAAPPAHCAQIAAAMVTARCDCGSCAHFSKEAPGCTKTGLPARVLQPASTVVRDVGRC